MTADIPSSFFIPEILIQVFFNLCLLASKLSLATMLDALNIPAKLHINNNNFL